MKKLGYLSLALFAVYLVTPATVRADVVLDSGAGLATCLWDATGTSCSPGADTVVITAHPAWQTNNPVNPGDPSDTSAVWISNALSGYGDSQFQPYNGTVPVFRLTLDFTTLAAGGLLNLNVWADDTAGVFLDGVSLFDPKFTQNTCSGQVIGCESVHVGAISNLALSAGYHYIDIDVYQVGTGTDSASNPFGVLFTGTATNSSVPEPEAILLTALMGAIVFAGSSLRKRFA